jgi:hypothetical protein
MALEMMMIPKLGGSTPEAEPTTYSDLVVSSKLMDYVTVESSVPGLVITSERDDVVLENTHLTTEVIVYDKIC